MNGDKRILLFILCLCLVLGGGTYFWLLRDIPNPNDIPEYLNTPSIRIIDRNGILLYESLVGGGGRHSVLPITAIPLALRQATIATEDSNFYQHPGVDITGIMRAFWINLRGGETLAGGSTITQQVARNLFLEPEERYQRSLRRKLRESLLAWQLARRYTKDEILAFYLNQTYYGGLAYGVEAAAQTFFGKAASELDLAESALIAGLPQAPSFYDPLIDPATAKERQQVVLSLMEKDGYISSEERQLAEREILIFETAPYPMEAPHFVLWVRAMLDDLLAPEQLEQSITARTTLDLDWQHHAEEIMRRQIENLQYEQSGPGYNVNNAALIALHPATGEILAMVGSPDYFDAEHSGAVNMAITPRQPGSALKPLVYAAAFDPTLPNSYTPATMILDVSTTFTTHEEAAYTPHNYDGLEHGPVSAREALASSLNIPAVIALDFVGLETFSGVTADFGITTLGNPEAYDLSIALGGGEVSLLELSAAYAVFANGGSRVDSISILDIQDNEGNILYQAESPSSIQVLDERVAWLISDILSDNDARVLGFSRNSTLKIDRPAAVKTGTTSNFHDNWTVGYNPSLVVGVWVGNTNHEPMRDITGLTGAAPIWHKFTRTVLSGQSEESFVQPEGLVQTEVCALSGLLPSEACPYRRLEWFIEGTQPEERDTFYRMVEINAATGFLATENTLPEDRITQTVLDLPPEAQPWARSQGLILLSDVINSQTEMGTEAALRIVHPGDHAVYVISPNIPADVQQLHIQAVSQGEFDHVSVWLDGEVIAELSQAPYEVWWTLSEGKHQVWATAITLEGVKTNSQIVEFDVNSGDK